MDSKIKDRMEQDDSGVVPIQPGEILGLTCLIICDNVKNIF